MSNDIATMASVQEKVRERIQSTFLDLIPSELWEGMVAAELKKFTAETLPQMVKDAAKNKFTALLQEELAKPEWRDRYASNGMQSSPLVNQILREIAPELVQAMFGDVAQRIVSAVRNGQLRY